MSKPSQTISKEISAQSGKKLKRAVSTKESPGRTDSLNRKCGSTPGQAKGSKSTRTAKDVHTPRSSNKRQLETKEEEMNEELLNKMSKALTFLPWFHGMMPRESIEELLVNEGDFLLRRTEVAKKIRYAVTVLYNGRIRHILLNYKNEQWALRDLKKPTVTELIEGHVSGKIPVMSDGTLLISGIPRSDFYILHEHVELKLNEKLGSGAFADVYAAKWTCKDDTVMEVAVKRLKGVMDKKQRAEFVREAKLMSKLDHQNIVKVFGVALQEEPILIVLELSPGSLVSKLKSNPHIKNDVLLRYTTDACRGMCYLAARKIIHRDIAARNVLLGKNDEAKISDFGLSIGNNDKEDKIKQRMPIRWLAPEVLRKGSFSTKSDVWSFGVLTWEIFNRAKTHPFPGLSIQEAKEKILSGNQPMEAPNDAPVMIKSLMLLCFTQDPLVRPEFETLLKLLAPKETPPSAPDDANDH